MLYNHKRKQHGAMLSELANFEDAEKLRLIVNKQEFVLTDPGKVHDRLRGG